MYAVLVLIVNSSQNPIDPEPCDDCDLGIMYILGHDGIRRCKNCIQELARQKGWDVEDWDRQAAWELAKRDGPKTPPPVDDIVEVPMKKVDFSANEQVGLFDVEAPEPEKELGPYPRKGTLKEKVLVFIARQREEGATDDEMSLLLKAPVTSISANRNQLMSLGWVKDSGRRRKIRSGNMGTVWTLTNPARDKLIDS